MRAKKAMERNGIFFFFFLHCAGVDGDMANPKQKGDGYNGMSAGEWRRQSDDNEHVSISTNNSTVISSARPQSS